MNMQENRMNEGSGNLSYAENSLIQAHSITKTYHVIKDALEGLYSSMTPKCVKFAELGCASGPNTLMLIPELVNITNERYKSMEGKEVPQIEVFLNDRYFNDFNAVSRSLPTFLVQLNQEKCDDVGPLYISMTPGTYHNRVFPDNSLHFVHCANSSHWLSELPKELLNIDEESWTKGYVYLTETSPPQVVKAYQQQFAKDFSSFLKCRSQELVQHGRMVVNIMVSSKKHGPHRMWVMKFINMVLRDMLLEGMVDHKKVDNFDIPFYPPTMEEVKTLVSKQGSFILDKHEIFTLEWDVPNYSTNKIDEMRRAMFVTDTARVAIEYMLSSQFGEELLKEFHQRFTHYVYQSLKSGIQLNTFHQIISLKKK